MKMPGFTAETSLYETRGHYRMAAADVSATLVLPQGNGGKIKWKTCCIDGYCSPCMTKIPELTQLIDPEDLVDWRW